MTGHNIFKSILSLFLSYDKTFYTWEVNMARIIDTAEKNLIGHKVKQLRKKHHMSQKELSEKLETYAVYICRGSISRIEDQSRTVTDIELYAISKIFQISIEKLFD